MSYNYDRRVATGTPDKAFWQRREQGEEREIQAIKKRLNQYYGGVFDEYAGLGSSAANRLRRELEVHRVSYWAAREGREPTRQEIDEALRRLGSAIQHAKAARIAGGPWAWKPIPGPRGSRPGEYDGYVTQNGRAELRPETKETRGGPKKTKEWYLLLDGKKHEIHSRRPEFGHAEAILQRELGPDYAQRASS